jgi:plasmid maintenance system antidote protein VapI
MEGRLRFRPLSRHANFRIMRIWRKRAMGTMIGQVLLAWRRENGLNIREGARAFGVSQATLSRIERGKPISAATMIRLLNWLFA